MAPPKTLPAELESLAPLREHVASEARDAGLDPKTVYRLCLAVDEIATNIILYGLPGASRPALRVAASLTDEAFVITLEDEGPPYDPRGHQVVSREDLARPLEERRVGGLGIFLALEGVDRLEYESAAGVNRTRFIVNRAATG